MADLPPGLAKLRASLAPAPNPEAVPRVGHQSSKPASRDASPERQPAAARLVIDPSKWKFEDKHKQFYCAIWSTRRNKYISEPQIIKPGTKERTKFKLAQFYPRMDGFVRLKQRDEMLELRNPVTEKCMAQLDLDRYNLRVDPQWKLISKKKKKSSPRAGSSASSSSSSSSDSDDDDDDAEDEDTLEEFVPKLNTRRADMSSEDGDWKVRFRICPNPHKPGTHTILIESISVRLKKVSPEFERQRQNELEREAQELLATSASASSFFQEVQALQGRRRARVSRFTEQERRAYLGMDAEASAESEQDNNDDNNNEVEDSDADEELAAV